MSSPGAQVQKSPKKAAGKVKPVPAKKPKQGKKQAVKETLVSEPDPESDVASEASEDEDVDNTDAPSEAPAGAVCELCDGSPCCDPSASTADNKLVSVDGRYVHEECAVWCPEVYYSPTGALVNVDAALRRARRLRCAHCGAPGAAVGCQVGKCRKTYHLPCLAASDAQVNEETYAVRCPMHALPAEGAGPSSGKGKGASKGGTAATKAAPKEEAADEGAAGTREGTAVPAPRSLEPTTGRTRSGRAVMKPVAYWEGSRVEKDQAGHVLGVRRGGLSDLTGNFKSTHWSSLSPASSKPPSGARAGAQRGKKAAPSTPSEATPPTGKRKGQGKLTAGGSAGGAGKPGKRARKTQESPVASLAPVAEEEPTPHGTEAAGVLKDSDGDSEEEEEEQMDESGWRVSEVEALYAAHARIKPTAPNFWQKVAKHVPGRSSNECFTRFFATHPTPAPAGAKAKTKTKANGDGRDGGSAARGGRASDPPNPAAAIAAAAPPPPRGGRGTTVTAVRKRARELHEETRAADAAHAAEVLGPAAARGTEGGGGAATLSGSDVLRRPEDRSNANAYIEGYLKRTAAGKRKQQRAAAAGGAGGSGGAASSAKGGGGQRFKDMAAILAAIRSAEGEKKAAEDADEDALNEDEDYYFSDASE